MKKIAITVVAAMAMTSVFATPIWVMLQTEGADGETSGVIGNYEAYYCTKQQAGDWFDGNNDVDSITAYLTQDVATYKKGMDALKSGGTAFTAYGYDEGQYAFSKYLQTALSGDFIALTAYSATGEANQIRVFSASASSSSLTFDPSKSKGSAGSWTQVPEPTSGMLFLLGSALLALKRKSK